MAILGSGSTARLCKRGKGGNILLVALGRKAPNVIVHQSGRIARGTGMRRGNDLSLVGAVCVSKRGISLDAGAVSSLVPTRGVRNVRIGGRTNKGNRVCVAAGGAGTMRGASIRNGVGIRNGIISRRNRPVVNTTILVRNAAAKDIASIGNGFILSMPSGSTMLITSCVNVTANGIGTRPGLAVALGDR